MHNFVHTFAWRKTKHILLFLFSETKQKYKNKNTHLNHSRLICARRCYKKTITINNTYDDTFFIPNPNYTQKYYAHAHSDATEIKYVYIHIYVCIFILLQISLESNRIRIIWFEIDDRLVLICFYKMHILDCNNTLKKSNYFLHEIFTIYSNMCVCAVCAT